MCRGSCKNPCECCFSCCVGGDYDPNCYNCSFNSIFLCLPRCIGCIGCPTCLETKEHAIVRRSKKQSNQIINQPPSYVTQNYIPQTMISPQPVIMAQPRPIIYNINNPPPMYQ
jgi:hypothetical protein